MNSSVYFSTVQGPDEIEKILAQQTSTKTPLPTLLNSVATVSKPSPLAQEVTADSSDNESVQDSDNEEPTEEFDDPGTAELFDILFTEAETHTRSQKSTKRTSKSNAQKRANLPLEIFDYMHTAKCRRLFSLS